MNELVAPASAAVLELSFDLTAAIALIVALGGLLLVAFKLRSEWGTGSKVWSEAREAKEREHTAIIVENRDRIIVLEKEAELARKRHDSAEEADRRRILALEDEAAARAEREADLGRKLDDALRLLDAIKEAVAALVPDMAAAIEAEAMARATVEKEAAEKALPRRRRTPAEAPGTQNVAA